jgi:hypothetical protein
VFDGLGEAKSVVQRHLHALDDFDLLVLGFVNILNLVGPCLTAADDKMIHIY